jgi:hypothetical protein
MPNTQIFNLPNGCRDLSGEIQRQVELRELDGFDEDLIRDKKNLREGNILDKLLKRCLVRFGSTTNPEEITRIYDNHLWMADVTYMLVMLRAHSIDPLYRFEAACPNCEYMGGHRIDLLSLPIDEQKDEFRGQEKFQRMAKGQIIEFVPLLAKHGALLEEIRINYKGEKGTRKLVVQLKKLGGEEVNPKIVKSLGWGLRQEIRNEMDKVSGGIDIELAMECHRCDRVFKDVMPIELKSFFFPTVGTSEPRTAYPYRRYGATQLSSAPDGDGDQKKSDTSPSESAPTTPTAL